MVYGLWVWDFVLKVAQDGNMLENVQNVDFKEKTDNVVILAGTHSHIFDERMY